MTLLLYVLQMFVSALSIVVSCVRICAMAVCVRAAYLSFVPSVFDLCLHECVFVHVVCHLHMHLRMCACSFILGIVICTPSQSGV